MSRRFPFVISFVLGLLCAPMAVAQQDVTWTNLVNATAFSNTVQKTGGCDGCQDAGGLTQQQIARGVGSFQFAPGSGQEIYAGLTHTTKHHLFFTALDYTFAIYPVHRRALTHRYS